MFHRSGVLVAGFIVILLLGCGDSSPMTPTGPVAEVRILIDSINPSTGTTVRVGESLDCRSSFRVLNAPPNGRVTEVWKLDGAPTLVCDSLPESRGGEELAFGVPPVRASEMLAPGTYQVSVEICEEVSQVCKESAPQTVIVKEQVDQFVFYGAVDHAFYIVDEDGGVPEKLLDDLGADWLWPSLSQSGDTIFYTALGSCAPERTVFMVRRDGTGKRELAGRDASGNCPAVAARAPRISPDGKSVIFYAWATDPEIQSASIFEVGVDGSGFRMLKAFTTFDGAVYHPNGREAIMTIKEYVDVSGGESRRREAVVALDLYTGEERRLWTEDGFPEDPWSVRPLTYDLSPDGRWVVATSFKSEADGGARTVVIPTDGSGTHRVIGPNVKWAWSCGRGLEVCYVPRSEPNSWYKSDLNGQGARRMGTLPQGIEMPAPYRRR